MVQEVVVLNRVVSEVTPEVYIQPMRAVGLPIHREGMGRASRTIAEKPFLVRPTDVVGVQGLRCQVVPSRCHMSTACS